MFQDVVAVILALHDGTFRILRWGGTPAVQNEREASILLRRVGAQNSRKRSMWR